MKILINVLYVWGLKFNAVIIQSEKVSHAIRLLFLTSFFLFLFFIYLVISSILQIQLKCQKLQHNNTYNLNNFYVARIVK